MMPRPAPHTNTTQQSNEARFFWERSTTAGGQQSISIHGVFFHMIIN